MNAYRTLDVGICLDILTEKQMFEDISEEGATFNDLKVNVIDDYWVALELNNELVGVAQFKPISSCCYESHIHILGKHRKEHAINAGTELIKWCEENLEGSLHVRTPSYFKGVVKYLESFGFIVVGEIEKAWRKNGKLNSMIILHRGLK